MITTDITKWESTYPGCSNEPPWWPSSRPVHYRAVPHMPPDGVHLRGSGLPLLIATRERGTLAYWSVVLHTWVIVLH